MATEQVPTIINIAGGPSIDGKSIVVVAKFDNGRESTFGIPLLDVPTVIGSMLNDANRAAKRSDAADLEALTLSGQGSVPLATGIQLATTEHPDRHLISLTFGHFALRAWIERKDLRKAALAILAETEDGVSAEPEG